MRLPLEPALQSFFKLLLNVWVSLGMPGTRHELAPAVTVEQAVDRAVIHMLSDSGFKGSPDLCCRRKLASLSPSKEGGKELRFFFQGQILMSSPRNPKRYNKVMGGTTGKPCSWAN